MHDFAAIITSWEKWQFQNWNLKLLAARRQPFEVIHLIRPAKKLKQIALFSPEKADNVLRLETFSFFAGVCLDPPLQVFAAPGPQPMATSGIPDKTERRKHHANDTACFTP